MKKKILKGTKSILSFILATAMVMGLSGTTGLAAERTLEPTVDAQTILVKEQVNGTADTDFSFFICQVTESNYPIETIGGDDSDIHSAVAGADLSYTIYDTDTGDEIGTGTTDEDGVFSLEDGEYAEFIVPAGTDWYVRQNTPEEYPLAEEDGVTAEGTYASVVTSEEDIPYGIVQYEPEEEPAPTAEPDKTALQEAYDDGLTLDESEYTAKSWEPFAAAMEKAKEVLDDEDATQEAIDEALAGLEEARDGLKKAETVSTPNPASAAPTVTISTGLTGNTKTYDAESITLTASVKNLPEGAEASYQWYKDGEAIEGATQSTFTVPGSVSDSGTYKCVVTVKDGSGETSVEGETTITIEKAAQHLAFETEMVEKACYDEPFIQELIQTDVVGAITYATSDADVATVDSSTGKVSIHGTGAATITASVAGDDNHEAASASYVLVVNTDEITWQIEAGHGELTWDEETGEYVDDLPYDGESIALSLEFTLTEEELAQTQEIRLQWYRYNPETQEFDAIEGATGSTYTLEGEEVNAGDYIYQCEVAVIYKNGNTHTVYSPIEVRIAKLAQSISYGQTELEKDVCEAPFTNELTVNVLSPEEGAGVTYASSDETIAAVDAATGEVTLLEVGEVMITATAVETTNYETADASYVLTVKPHEHVWSEVTWTWNEDHTSATASRTCAVCGETETADATKITHTTTATATKPGETTYTATAEFADGTEVTDTATVETDAIDPDGFITVIYNGEEIQITNVAIDAAIEAADEQTFTYTSGDNENSVTKQFVLLSDLTGITDFCCYTVTAKDGYITEELPAGTYLYWRDDEACYRTAVNGGTGSQWVDAPAVIEVLPHTWSGEVTWTWSEDYSEAAATRTCTVCGREETAEATTITHTTTATATKPGETTYTATAEFADGTEVTDTTTVETDAIDPDGFITVIYNGEEIQITNVAIDAAIEAADEQTFTYTSKGNENSVTKQFVLISDLTGIEDFCCYTVTAKDGYIKEEMPADTYLYWRDDEACYRTAVNGGTGSQWVDAPATIEVVTEHIWGEVEWTWTGIEGLNAAVPAAAFGATAFWNGNGAAHFDISKLADTTVTATATRTCTICGRSETAEAEITSTTEDPTATKPGETVYTATAEFADGTVETNEQTEIIPATEDGEITILIDGEETTALTYHEINEALAAAKDQTFTYTSEDGEEEITKPFALISDMLGIDYDFCSYTVTAFDESVSAGLPTDTYLYLDDTWAYRTAVDDGPESQWVIDPVTIDVVTKHTWSVEWDWSDDYSAATATRTCTACGATETVEAEVSVTEIKERTQEDDGEELYTATATFSDGQVATAEKTKVLPAYGPPRAFAVYSRTDQSLTFYMGSPVPTVGETYKDKVVTELYLDVDQVDPPDVIDVPWRMYYKSITSVVFDESFHDAQPISLAFWFYEFSNATFSGLEYLDTSQATSMRRMFYRCYGLDGPAVSEWDTSKIMDMNGLFYECTALTGLNVSGWDPSRVTDMANLFQGCSALTGVDISAWNTESVTDMNRMFYNCESLTSVGDLSEWKTGSVTDMNRMFDGCSALTGVGVSGWNTENVTDMSYMFRNCASLAGLDPAGWNTSSVTTMAYMFSGCESLADMDVSGWNTENVINMYYMFTDCASLTGLGDLEEWDTGSATSFSYMFQNCASLESLDASGWDTSAVTTMTYMFDGCESLTELGASGWKTGSVTDMSYMFQDCVSLESLDASGWNTSSVTTMRQMFRNCSSLTFADTSTWNTTSVTDMRYMFYDCASLEGLDLSSWDTTGLSSSSCSNFAIGCEALEWVKIGENTDIFTKGKLVDKPNWYDSPDNGNRVSTNYLQDVKDPGQYWSSTHRDKEDVVNYAVKIWGINADTYSEDGGDTLQLAGLTFGPATGESYLESYKAHVEEDECDPEGGVYCIHWMSWEDIIAQCAIDPNVFKDCKDNGCTKAVELTPNSKLFNSLTVDNAMVEDHDGDGVGTLYYLLNGPENGVSYFSTGVNWNYSEENSSSSDPAYLYTKSRVRVTLNGDRTAAELKYASSTSDGSDLCDETNCLFSCFPADLQEAIVPRKTLPTSEGNGDPTVYDKLWLFSANELGESYNYDIGVDYGMVHENADRIAYEYSGTSAETAAAGRYWTRTCLPRTDSVFDAGQSGFLYAYRAPTYASGLAPGFCLPGPAVSSVDKSALQAEYDADLLLNEEDYTASSWKAFTETLADTLVILDDNAATQISVDEALEVLQTARKNLVMTAAMTPWTTARYAVKIWGIGTDTYSEDEGEINYQAGLTFGPATGDNESGDGTGYITTYKAHLTRDEYEEDDEAFCIHWMSWEEIIAQDKKDPTVFEECKENGCTKAVEFTTNDYLFNETAVANAVEQGYTGDGVSTLLRLLNCGSPNYACSWNYTRYDTSRKAATASNPADLYSKSRVRVTLTGDASDAELQYASSTGDGSDLCNENNCLLSCFPEELQEAVVPRTTVNARASSSYTSAGDKTTYDKLFLFSFRETGMTSSYDDAGGESYGISDRAAYEFDSADATTLSTASWWTRSRDADPSSMSVNYHVLYVTNRGSGSSYSDYGFYGLSPGFSLPGAEGGEPTVSDVTVTSSLDGDTKVYDGDGFILSAFTTLMPASSEVSYQWYKVGSNGTDELIEGATEREYTLAGKVADSGTYKCVVTATNDGLTGTGEGTIKITIDPAAQDISYVLRSVNRTLDDEPFTIPLTETTISSDDGAGVTYKSSNTSAATVDADTGKVTIHATGTVTITATAVATANFAAATASYTISITETEPDTVSYAVKLWGILTDVDEDGYPLGLTFGPATGADYINDYKAHITQAQYEAGGICIHWMSWDEIIAQSEEDPTVFQRCLSEGCTKAVELTPNSTLFDSSMVSLALDENYTGDGVSTLNYLLNSTYRTWNYSYSGYSNSDRATIYSRSRIRTTLTGDSADARERVNEGYNNYYGKSSLSDLLDEDNCLFSCFPESLRAAIVPRETQNTGNLKSTSYGSSANDKTTYDKLFLFSLTEAGVSTSYDDSGGSDYGIHSSVSDRAVYEFSSASSAESKATSWWTRSPFRGSSNYYTYRAAYLYSTGTSDFGGNTVSVTGIGISPGFCLPGPPLAQPTVSVTVSSTLSGQNDTKVYDGGGVSLTARATITPTDYTETTYQWYKDDVALAGKTTSVLNIDGTVADTGTYKCVVTAENQTGSASDEAAVAITITPAAQDISFAEEVVEKTTLDEPFTITAIETKLSAESGAGITYASSDPEVATVDEKSGEVTILADGETTITATAAATANYAEASASYTLTVTYEEPLDGEAFAVYSEEAGSLAFYVDSSVPEEGETYKGTTVTAVYEDVDQLEVTGTSGIPWYGSSTEAAQKTSVVIDESFKAAKPISVAYWFYNLQNATFSGLEYLDTSKAESTYRMFYQCYKLTDAAAAGVSDWDTSNVNTMLAMFYGCTGLTSLDVSGWDISNVTSLEQVFRGCSGLTSLDLSKWDTSSATTINSMFYDCTALTGVDGLSGWDTSAVTNMGSVFRDCYALDNVDVSDWDTSAVTTMTYMFYHCDTLESVDVSDWDVSAVTNVTYMFRYCSSLTALDLSGWDTSKVTSYNYFARNCDSLACVVIGEKTDLFTKGQLVDQRYWYDAPEDGNRVSSSYLQDVTEAGTYWTY